MSAIKPQDDYMSWLLNTPNGKRLSMARGIVLRQQSGAINIKSGTPQLHKEQVARLKAINKKLHEEGKLIAANQEILDSILEPELAVFELLNSF